MWRRVQVHTIERGKNVLSLDNNPRANQPAQDEPPTALPPGTLVPDFPLQSTPDHAVSLRDFRGHPVILAFSSAIGCGDQMALSNEILPSSTASRPSCSGSQWMGSGVMPLLPGPEICTFPCLQTSSPKGPSPNGLECIVDPMGRVNVPYSCWMPRG